MDGVAGETQKLIHLLKEQATIVSNSAQMGQRLQKGILTLGVATRLVNTRLALLETELQKRTRATDRRLEHYLGITSTLREVEYTLNAVKEDVLALTSALQDTALGKLSPYFLTPTTLLQIFQKAQPHLSPDVTFLTDLQSDVMYLYYNLVQVTATTTPAHLLRLFIEVPLRAPNRMFSLYRAWPLPTPLGNHSAAVYIQPAFQYLAVTSDQQSYFELDASDLTQCQRGILTVCAPQKPVRHPARESCLYSLFVGNAQNVKKVCDKIVVKDPESFLYRPANTNHWIYSVSHTLLIVQCPTTGTVNVSKVSIEGTGILSVPPNCYVHHADYTLLPHSSHSAYYGESHPAFHAPPIANLVDLISFANPQTLDPEAPKDDAVDRLLNSLPHTDTLKKGVSVQKFQEELAALQEAPQVKIYSHYFPKMGLVGIVTLAALMLYIFRGRLTKAIGNRCGRRARPIHAETYPPLTIRSFRPPPP